MLTRWRALRSRPAAGAAMLEVAAAWGIAALVIAAVVMGVQGANIAAFTGRVLCTVMTAVGGGTCGDPGTEQPPPTDPPFDPKPKKCKLGDKSEKVNSVVKIGFIEFGENAGFVETTYSDGTVTYTATDGASLGVTGGFGADLEMGALEAGAKVDFGAGFKVDYGSTWVFEDADEAAEMREQLNKYLMEQEMIRHDSTGGYSLGVLISGGFTDPPKPPSQHVSTFEVNADVGGKVGLSLPFESGNDDSGVPNLNLAEAGVKYGGSNKWTKITDDDSGNTTWTTTGESFGEASGTLGPLSGQLKGVLGTSLAITRDSNDQIIKVALVTTREGKATSTVNSGHPNLGGSASESDSDGRLTVTTTSLDVTTDDQRNLVQAWLAAQESGGAVSSETLYPDRLVDGDPFQNLMYTNATVSNVQYSNVSDKSGFAAEVKVGVAFGVDFSLETSETSAEAATYLDAPGTGGVRPPVDFAECVP
jgi:hypothetical protein